MAKRLPSETADRIEKINRHVCLRVKARRVETGVSQKKLARALGLTFQQVQKYEKGENKVSSGDLHVIAGVLEVPVSFFYEGLE